MYGVYGRCASSQFKTRSCYASNACCSSNQLSETREKLEALLNTENFDLSEYDKVLARKSDMPGQGCCMCGKSQTKDAAKECPSTSC